MRARGAGFTLIELLLAILLLALLMAGAYSGIRTAVGAMRSGEAYIDRVNRLRVAQEFVRHQISRALPLAFGQEDGTGKPYLFEGDGRRMRFVAPMPGYLSHGGPYVQTLELVRDRNGMLLRFNNAMLNGFDLKKLRAKDENEPVILMDQIQDGRFEYRKLEDDGRLSNWSDRWDDASRTPVMVRIALRMRKQAQTDWPVLDVPLLIDAGAASGSGGGVTFDSIDRDRATETQTARPMRNGGSGVKETR